VTHDFDIGDATMDYFAPAVASDGYGDIVIAASESNENTDATNVFLGERPPFTAVTGTINGFQTQYSEYTGPDWGGYSAVAVDPAEPASVWTNTQGIWADVGSPGWNTVGLEVLATTPKSWPGSTPAIGTRDDQTASLIYRRADGKLEWLQSGNLCPDCWGQAQYFTPTGGATAAPAFTPDLAFGDEWLFTRRADNHIWWLEALSGGAWRDLGGYATSAPTTMTGGGCPVDVLIRGADGAVHLKFLLSTWPNGPGGTRSAARSRPAPSPARSPTPTATKPYSSAGPTTASTGSTATAAVPPGAAGHPWAARPPATPPPPRRRTAPSTCSGGAQTTRCTPGTSMAAPGAAGPISAEH